MDPEAARVPPRLHGLLLLWAEARSRLVCAGDRRVVPLNVRTCGWESADPGIFLRHAKRFNSDPVQFDRNYLAVFVEDLVEAEGAARILQRLM